MKNIFLPLLLLALIGLSTPALAQVDTCAFAIGDTSAIQVLVEAQLEPCAVLLEIGTIADSTRPSGQEGWAVKAAYLTCSAQIDSANFFVGQCPASLPVEWLHFSARPDGSLVRLAWATAQELNSDRFEVERSADGQSWDAIGSVAAAGMSDAPSDYQFNDQSAPAGRTYYRLRQVDLDGAHDYSNVVEVSIEIASSDLRVSSLADGHGAYVHGLTSRGQLQLFDLSGRLVATHALADAGAVQLNLIPGLYAATVTDGRGTIGTGKVLVTP